MDRDSATSDRDLVVIGAGPGGYVAAIRGAQLGRNVTVVDDAGVGGVCLNHGCIPSKALLTGTGRVDAVTDAGHMGIYSEPYIDFGELLDWKDGIIETLTRGVRSLFRTHEIEFLDGHAAFVDDSTIAVDTGTRTHELSFEHAIVATGSRPVELDGFSFDASPILSSREALSLPELPSRLVIVGAGYIGMELATVFANLGTDVTVLEALSEPLSRFDAGLTRPVVANLEQKDVSFHFDCVAEGWTRTADGNVVTADIDGETRRFDCENAIVAVGREPVTDGLRLEEAGITTENGFIETDDRLLTTNERVFAVGDVAGEPMLAHKASHEGIRAATNASETGPDADSGHPDVVPAVVYTDPEIATVGLSERDATDAGYNVLVGEFPFSANGRALTTDHSEGFVRIVADEADGTVLGGAIVGPEASELLPELVLAIEHDLTVLDIESAIHSHPTLSEAVMEAAAAASGRAIHHDDG